MPNNGPSTAAMLQDLVNDYTRAHGENNLHGMFEAIKAVHSFTETLVDGFGNYSGLIESLKKEKANG